MADVFLSYAQEDRARARQVADALRELGCDVWWDAHLYVGTSVRGEITQQLETAKCVVVLWSKASIKSAWVIDEAQDGADRDVLVQGLIEAVRPPHGFRGIHWANLTSWSGDLRAEEFVKLADGISRFAPGFTTTPTPAAHLAQQSYLAPTAPESGDHPRERPPSRRWRNPTVRFTAVLAKRPRFVVAGLSVAVAAALTLYVSGLPAERAQQTAPRTTDKPVASSSSSAMPSTDAALGQNGGNDSPPRSDQSPSVAARSSPAQSLATASPTEIPKKRVAPDKSPSPSPPANSPSSARRSAATSATEHSEPPDGSRSPSPPKIDGKFLETPPSATTSSPATTSPAAGEKPAPSDSSPSAKSTTPQAPATGALPLTASITEPSTAAPEPASSAPKIYSSRDANVVPPIALIQQIPPYPGSTRVPIMGVIEVVIDTTGAVESASMVIPINPQYDKIVVEAARLWRYEPARLDGVPVKFLKRIQLSLIPNTK